MPGPAPLPMPPQDLAAGGPHRGRWDGRRALLVAATAALTAGATGVMAGLLAPGGVAPAEAASLALFVVLFGWVAFGFVSALAGFLALWRRPLPRRREPPPVVFSRCAILFPVYNEEPGRILAAVQAIHEDLSALGAAELYDIHILSDTRDETIARAEAVGVVRLRARRPGAPVFYRRRPENTDRKAGNVADWVRRQGGAYEFMLVLDADSLMSGDTILRMTAAMENDPKLGLLQTSPVLINAETLFARLQQFAACAYGRMQAAGLDWWSQSEGNYWGHNAIIRTRAFAACAGLPHLKGPKPFGGHILSHDFVEAALLRRAGWGVRLAPHLGGSYEEGPPTIVDMARRDRRWCQGNLQHGAVLGTAGLHWVSRLHLARGILSYLCSPLWLAMLVLGSLAWSSEAHAAAADVRHQAAALFGFTLAMLVVPKVLSAVLLWRMREAGGFGGGWRLALGVAVEAVCAALAAPVLMLMQCAAVIDVLVGRDAGWSTQQRDHGRLTRKEAWRVHRAHVLIGLAGAACAAMLDPMVFWWCSPVCLGLALSAPLSALLASAELGRASRRIGLLRTPEEMAPPPVVRRAGELRAAYDAEEPVRREIERLFRAEVPAYRPVATPGQRMSAYTMRLAAE